MMVGNNITYEPAFVSNLMQAREIKDVSAMDSKVSVMGNYIFDSLIIHYISAGINRRSLSTITGRLRSSSGIRLNNRSVSGGELFYNEIKN